MLGKMHHDLCSLFSFLKTEPNFPPAGAMLNTPKSLSDAGYRHHSSQQVFFTASSCLMIDVVMILLQGASTTQIIQDIFISVSHPELSRQSINVQICQ